MSLQGNGNNHNYRPDLNDENDSFLKFNDSEQYTKITGQNPTSIEQDGSVEFGASEDERKKKLQEAIEQENSSAYEDLDDFIYKQNKRRARTSGHRHHHRHISPSVLSPGRARRKKANSNKKKHKHRHHYRKHHHRKKRLKKWQKIVLGIIIGLISLILIAIIAVVFMYFSGKNALLDNSGMNIQVPDFAETSDNGQYITYNGHKYKYNDRIANVLCMGVDRSEKTLVKDENGNVSTGGQADSLFLASMDVDSGEIHMVNISRETMTDVNVYTSSGKAAGSRNEQICLAYAYGDGEKTSCQNELVAVRRLFYNLPVNFYMALNVDGIVPINDSVGGVMVKSPETIKEFVEGETYNLQGSLAESFVRNRSHADFTGNNKRMERQKVYLDAFAQNVFTKARSNIFAPIDVYNDASPYLTTNIGLNEVTYFSVNALRGNFSGLHIENVPGEVKEGKKYAEFYVDEKKFFELFLKLYYIQVE